MRLSAAQSQWEKADFHKFYAGFFGFSRFLPTFAGFQLIRAGFFRG
jgi:hypothetical protein